MIQSILHTSLRLDMNFKQVGTLSSTSETLSYAHYCVDSLAPLLSFDREEETLVLPHSTLVPPTLCTPLIVLLMRHSILLHGVSG